MLPFGVGDRLKLIPGDCRDTGSILMIFGHSDQVSSSWGNEQTYYTALKVFKLLGVPDHIATLKVPGFHGANDEEADLDWLDQQFGRSTKKWANAHA